MKTKLKPCQGGCGETTVIWKQHAGKRLCRECWSKIKPMVPLKQSPIKSTQKPIPKQSPRRKKLDAAYSILRKQYLKDHPNCELNCSAKCSRVATDIHHLYWSGDREEFMNDFKEVKAGCRECHNEIHTKMSLEEVIERGFKKIKK